MNLLVRWTFYFSLIFLISGCASKGHEVPLLNHGAFVCPPCGLDCDTIRFKKDGICPHCKMNLIMFAEERPTEDVNLQSGSGNFVIRGGQGHEDNLIRIFYHLPANFGSSDKILIVIPGAGRNGNDYRDAWVEASEQHNVLVVSPSYPNDKYGFGEYHMAGMITNVSYDQDFIFDLNNLKDQWIYNDFDRIFLMLKKKLNFKANQYDIFGHSAGGQILNRLSLFYNSPYINEIISSNAGWYTTTDRDLELPYGINNTICDEEQLKNAFQKPLTLLIGEEDNASETRGTLQKSKLAMQQGAHRLARAQSFYKDAIDLAHEYDIKSRWKLVIVPKVGHDFRKMSVAASQYLYGDED